MFASDTPGHLYETVALVDRERDETVHIPRRAARRHAPSREVAMGLLGSQGATLPDHSLVVPQQLLTYRRPGPAQHAAPGGHRITRPLSQQVIHCAGEPSLEFPYR